MGLVAATAAVGAVATIGYTVANISASNSAKNAAVDAANQNNALQTSIYNQNSANMTPYVANGTAASNIYSGLLGIGDQAASESAYSTWKNATGYQSALKTGQDSTTAVLGAKGLTDSGAALKALTQYGQNYANSNLQTYLGNVGTSATTGANAAASLAGTSQNYANAVSTNNNNAATATGNSALSNANSISSALSSLSSLGTAALGSSYGSNSFGSGYASAANKNLTNTIGGNSMQDIGSSVWSS
jgi:hypothetical protein